MTKRGGVGEGVGEGCPPSHGRETFLKFERPFLHIKCHS